MVASAGTEPSVGATLSYAGPVHVRDVMAGLWDFEGDGTATLSFPSDGGDGFLSLRWDNPASGTTIFGFNVFANPLDSILTFTTCPAASGKSGPLDAFGHGTYTPTTVSGSGGCADYQSWKPTTAGEGTFVRADMFFSFVSLTPVP